MTSLSTAFSNKQTLVFLLAAFGAAIYLLVTGAYIPGGVVGVLAMLGLFIPVGEEGTCEKIFNDPLIRQIRDVLLKAGQGELSSRVTNIPDDHTLQGVAWGINDMLDQVEQMMRDISSSIAAANKGKHYRPIYAEGYKGDFQASVPALNTAINAIADSYKMTLRGELSKLFEKSTGGIGKGLNQVQEDILRNSNMLTSIARETKKTADDAVASEKDIKKSEIGRYDTFLYFYPRESI